MKQNRDSPLPFTFQISVISLISHNYSAYTSANIQPFSIGHHERNLLAVPGANATLISSALCTRRTDAP